MFGWLRRSPGKHRERLTRERLRLLEEARDLQRGGDLIGFAAKTAEAAELERQIDMLDASGHGDGSS
jgi:hypothetical protein